MMRPVASCPFCPSPLRPEHWRFTPRIIEEGAVDVLYGRGVVLNLYAADQRITEVKETKTVPVIQILVVGSREMKSAITLPARTVPVFRWAIPGAAPRLRVLLLQAAPLQIP